MPLWGAFLNNFCFFVDIFSVSAGFVINTKILTWVQVEFCGRQSLHGYRIYLPLCMGTHRVSFVSTALSFDLIDFLGFSRTQCSACYLRIFCRHTNMRSIRGAARKSHCIPCTFVGEGAPLPPPYPHTIRCTTNCCMG